jgi:hypothetical protein
MLLKMWSCIRRINITSQLVKSEDLHSHIKPPKSESILSIRSPQGSMKIKVWKASFYPKFLYSWNGLQWVKVLILLILKIMNTGLWNRDNSTCRKGLFFEWNEILHVKYTPRLTYVNTWQMLAKNTLLFLYLICPFFNDMQLNKTYIRNTEKRR